MSIKRYVIVETNLWNRQNGVALSAISEARFANFANSFRLFLKSVSAAPSQKDGGLFWGLGLFVLTLWLEYEKKDT